VIHEAFAGEICKWCEAHHCQFTGLKEMGLAMNEKLMASLSRGHREEIRHIGVHRGKTGHGLGIDFEMAQGPCTLADLTQIDAGETFKLICTVGEIVSGGILHIGNPNCRMKLSKPLGTFIQDWCGQGPCHHSALGLGNHAKDIESFAEAMGFACVRI
jgi:L-arabinose isomerase